MHSVCPPNLHELLLWNALGNMQTSQEYFTTIDYAKFRGQTECIMDNWKILNSLPVREIEHAKSARPHGYYCAICSFSSSEKILQKKPYAFDDPYRRPRAWARVNMGKSILRRRQWSPMYKKLKLRARLHGEFQPGKSFRRIKMAPTTRIVKIGALLLSQFGLLVALNFQLFGMITAYKMIELKRKLSLAAYISSRKTYLQRKRRNLQAR